MNSTTEEKQTKLFLDIFKDKPEDKIQNYLDLLASRCDNDAEFEQQFFDERFELYCDVFGTERMLKTFQVSLPDMFDEDQGFENCKGCDGEDEDEDIDDEQSVMKDGVVYTIFQNDNTIQVRTMWEDKKLLSVVGNSEENITATLHNEDDENFVFIECDNKNPFIDKHVEHVSVLPEDADLTTIQVSVVSGIAYIVFDRVVPIPRRKEPVQLKVFGAIAN